SSPRKPSARSDRRVPAAPPSRLVSEGGSRISTSALQERERALDVHAEGLDRVERDARDRAARAVPVLPLGKVLLDGEGIRGPLLRTSRRTRGEPLLVQLGIGADHLDEAGLDLATLRKLDPLLTGGGHGVHGVDDDAAAPGDDRVGEGLRNEVGRESRGLVGVDPRREDRRLDRVDRDHGVPETVPDDLGDRALACCGKTRHHDEHSFTVRAPTVRGIPRTVKPAQTSSAVPATIVTVSPCTERKPSSTRAVTTLPSDVVTRDSPGARIASTGS